MYQGKIQLFSTSWQENNAKQGGEKNKFAPQDVVKGTIPPEKRGPCFIHALWQRCQDFCPASLCSTNAVPATRSVATSLPKQCCQAGGKRNRWNGGVRNGRGLPMSRPFFLPFLCFSFRKGSERLGRRNEQCESFRLLTEDILTGVRFGSSRFPICRYSTSISMSLSWLYNRSQRLVGVWRKLRTKSFVTLKFYSFSKMGTFFCCIFNIDPWGLIFGF